MNDSEKDFNLDNNSSNDQDIDVSANYGLSKNGFEPKAESVPKYSLNLGPDLSSDSEINDINKEKEGGVGFGKRSWGRNKNSVGKDGGVGNRDRGNGNGDSKKNGVNKKMINDFEFSDSDKIKPSFSEKIVSFFKKKKTSRLDVLQTDLIKDEVEIKFEWKRDLPGAIILFIIALVIVLETYMFLSWWNQKREAENSHYLSREISYIKDEISKLEEDYFRVNDFKDNLSLSSDILRRHIYWTNFFSYLEKNTLKNLYYNSFSGDISGEYVLPATTNDVRAISFQSKVFLNDNNTLESSVSDEEIFNPGGGDRTYVNFNLNLKLNKNILNK